MTGHIIYQVNHSEPKDACLERFRGILHARGYEVDVYRQNWDEEYFLIVARSPLRIYKVDKELVTVFETSVVAVFNMLNFDQCVEQILALAHEYSKYRFTGETVLEPVDLRRVELCDVCWTRRSRDSVGTGKCECCKLRIDVCNTCISSIQAGSIDLVCFQCNNRIWPYGCGEHFWHHGDAVDYTCRICNQPRQATPHKDRTLQIDTVCKWCKTTQTVNAPA